MKYIVKYRVLESGYVGSLMWEPIDINDAYRSAATRNKNAGDRYFYWVEENNTEAKENP